MNKEKKSSRVVMLIIDALIAAVLLVLDQFTKHLAVVHLKNQPAYVIIDGVLELQYLENRGSAFLRCCCFSFSNFRNRRNSESCMYCWQ